MGLALRVRIPSRLTFNGGNKMAKQFDVSQEEILSAISSTSVVWNDLQKENLRGNLVCPLCNLIKNVYKVSFQKGSARGACLLCPVKYFGKFHICVGIGHVFNSSEITSDEMKSLRKTVLDNLEELKATVTSGTEYDRYIKFVINERKAMNIRRPEAPKPTGSPSLTKPRRIIKAGK